MVRSPGATLGRLRRFTSRGLCLFGGIIVALSVFLPGESEGGVSTAASLGFLALGLALVVAGVVFLRQRVTVEETEPRVDPAAPQSFAAGAGSSLWLLAGNPETGAPGHIEASDVDASFDCDLTDG